MKNIESARVSIVGQLKKFSTAIDSSSQSGSMPLSLGSQSGVVMRTELTEEDEEEEEEEEEEEADKKPSVPVFALEGAKKSMGNGV